MISLINYLLKDFTKVKRKYYYYIIIGLLLLNFLVLFTFRENVFLISETSLNTFTNIQLFEPAVDSLTLGSKFYFFSFERFLIGNLSFLGSSFLVLLWMVLYFSSVYLLISYFKKLHFSSDVVFLFIIFLTISPFIIYSIFSLSTYIISLLLFILFLNLETNLRFNLIKDKKNISKHLWFLTILSIIIPFLEFESALIFYMFYLFYNFSFPKFDSRFVLMGVLSSILFLIFTYKKIFFIGSNNFFLFNDFNFFNWLNSIITDFGANIGTNIFFFILGLVGIYGLILMKSKLKYMFIFLFFLILFHLFYPLQNSFYLLFFITLVAAMGYLIFKNRSWSESEIKSFSFLLIFCGLLFSTVSYEVRLIEFDINNEEVEFFSIITQLDESYLDLKNGVYISNKLDFDDSLFEGALVATNSKYSNLIKSYGGVVMTDVNDHLIPNLDSQRDLNLLFNSQHLNDYITIIKKRDLDFIFITKDMKDGLEWSNPKEGLLLNIDNRRLFQPVLLFKNYQLYKINKNFFIN